MDRQAIRVQYSFGGGIDMTKYALVNSFYTVINIILADENFPTTDWAKELAQTGQWISYSDDRPARIGDTYRPDLNMFIGKQPYESWQLDLASGSWVPPVEPPDYNKHYQWNEDTKSWQQLNEYTGYENIIWNFLKVKFPNTSENNLHPRLVSKMIDVQTQELISNLYTWGAEQGFVKEVGGQITEYYTLPPEGITADWVSRDPYNDQMLEYYCYQDFKELKYSMDGHLLQENHIVNSFSELPEDIQSSLSNYPNRNQIYMYANKPYGTIVEIRI